jgi:hypothetical protein
MTTNAPPISIAFLVRRFALRCQRPRLSASSKRSPAPFGADRSLVDDPRAPKKAPPAAQAGLTQRVRARKPPPGPTFNGWRPERNVEPVVFDKDGRRMRWKMSDAPLIQLIRAEMQQFTGRHYQIAFDQFDARSLQELLRFLLEAKYEHQRSQSLPGIPRRANQAEIEVRSRAA